jgi:hypothetical protein
MSIVLIAEAQPPVKSPFSIKGATMVLGLLDKCWPVWLPAGVLLLESDISVSSFGNEFRYGCQ